MNVRTALIAVVLLATRPLLAQTPSTGAPPSPPAHQPAAPARSPGAPPAPAAEKVDPAKEAAIRHLMDLTQSSKMGDNMSAYVTNQVRQILSDSMSPDRLAKLMEGFSQKLATAVPPNVVTDAAIPIYARGFSMEDLQGIIQFYETPVGQRMIKAYPEVARDTETVGMQIEQKGAMNVLEQMSSDYPELKPLLRPQPGDPDQAPAPAPAPEPRAPATAPK
jgi:uncharacterized protein